MSEIQQSLLVAELGALVISSRHSDLQITANDGMIEIRGKAARLELESNGGALSDSGGGWWYPWPSRDGAEYPSRALLETDSDRGRKLARDLVESLSKQNPGILVASRHMEVAAHEVWSRLSHRELARLMTRCDLVVGLVDEWETLSPVVEAAARGGAPVVIHHGATLPSWGPHVIECEMWSAESFASAIREAVALRIPRRSIPEGLETRLRELN